ncbi:MAG: hypothetical protein J2O44_05125 [Porphyrobacter sp.]|nr:hypothetical protein [Porphyrobacter sp.]
MFFAALSFTVMIAHEMTHHLTARAVCGAWGEMALSTFALAPGCDEAGRPWWLATMAGPLLTYALIWIGALWRSQTGLVLLFANLPMGRAMNVIMGGGDELIVGRALFGPAWAWPAMALIVALLLGPPLALAWVRLPQTRRWLWFAGLLLLPLLWDVVSKRILALAVADTPMAAGVPIGILMAAGAGLALTVVAWPRTPAASSAKLLRG